MTPQATLSLILGIALFVVVLSWWSNPYRERLKRYQQWMGGPLHPNEVIIRCQLDSRMANEFRRLHKEGGSGYIFFDGFTFKEWRDDETLPPTTVIYNADGSVWNRSGVIQ